MSALDYGVIAAVIVLAVLALRSLRKHKGCGECSGCPYHENCGKKKKRD